MSFMLSVQVVYYVFAVFGIWLFEGAIKPPPTMRYCVLTDLLGFHVKVSQDFCSYHFLTFIISNSHLTLGHYFQ